MAEHHSTHRITDDSGLLALIDPDAYDAFLGRNWSLDHFRAAMEREELVVWGTGREGIWTIEVVRGHPEATGDRAVRGPITVSDGRLLLVNWTQLTMAAQFEDVNLAETDREESLLFDPRRYCCHLVHWTIDSGRDETGPSDKPDMVLSLTKGASDVEPWNGIP